MTSVGIDSHFPHSLFVIGVKTQAWFNLVALKCWSCFLRFGSLNIKDMDLHVRATQFNVGMCQKNHPKIRVSQLTPNYL